MFVFRSDFIHAFAVLCVCLFVPVTIDAEQIPGDINRDGNVDFADFIILSQNFGKTGPPPLPPEPAVSERMMRAQRLLGFFTFSTVFRYGGSVHTDHYCFGWIQSEDSAASDDELVVAGINSLTLFVPAMWEAELNAYILSFRINEQHLYVFNFTDAGQVYGSSYIKDGTGVIKLGDFDSNSTKNDGKGLAFYNSTLSKAAIDPQADQAEPAGPEVVTAIDRFTKHMSEAGVPGFDAQAIPADM